jgi:hypothetical protein
MLNIINNKKSVEDHQHCLKLETEIYASFLSYDIKVHPRIFVE